MPEIRRAAIYARFSTDLQSDRSIDDQVALCRAYAEKQGLKVTRVYSDRARTSASLIGRDGVLQLMEDARAGAFDVLVVEALDRISRDQEDLAGVHKRLTFAGIDILAVHEGRADVIQIGIRGLVGSLFLQDLKHKVRRGMQGVVRDGRHAGGRAYGYRPIPGQPGEMQIVEHEAEVIRRIFRDYVAGITPREIAGALNAEGILPPRGTRWNASTINGNAARGYGILMNPLYAGRIVWNRVRMVRDPDTGRRISRLNPEAEWQEAEAPHLAIIDPATWSAAQRRKEARSKAHEAGRRDKTPKRPLSGLLRCGCCGGGMAIHDRSGAAIRIRCSTARESGACDNDKRYRLDKIEEAVFDQLQRQLAHPDYLREYLRVYHAERRSAARAAVRDRKGIERQLADVAAQFDRMLDLYARGLADGIEAEQRIASLQQQKRALEARLAEADEPPVVALHPGAMARYTAAIANLAARLSAREPQFDREMIEALHQIIASVTIFPPGAEGVVVEVAGWLQALTGEPWPNVGGLMVAEEGLEPPTRGL